MFIDRVLAYQDEFKLQYYKTETLNKLFGANIEWDSLINAIQYAQVFEVSNVSNYIVSHKPNWDAIAVNVRPSYNRMWFEYNLHCLVKSMPSKEEIKIGKVGLYLEVYESTKEAILFTLLLFGQDVHKTIHILPPVLRASCDTKGNLFPEYERMSNFGNNTALIAPAFMGLSLLHCKNVGLETINPSAPLQKARQKKGKLPLIKYHILFIHPMKERLKYLARDKQTDIRRAMHMVRGHFKDYTENALFGKVHGLYWWDAQVRGDLSGGIVNKDYKLGATK